jgi:hypothetical protein
MENNIKKRILLNLIDNLRKTDEIKYIDIWNEMCNDNYETCRRIRCNTDDEIEELRYDYTWTDFAELFTKSKYSKDDIYITKKNGILYSFNDIELFTDVNELVSFLLDKEDKPTWYDIDNYTYALKLEDNKDYIIRMIIGEYDTSLSYNDVTRFFNENDILSVADVMVLDFAKMVDEIKNPQPKAFFLKEDVWDEMKKILKGRETCEGWKDTLVFDLECRIKLICWGKEVDTNLIEIALRKNRYEQDVITLTSVWYDEDGNEMREYDNIMDLNFQEMCKVYEMMLKNL